MIINSRHCITALCRLLTAFWLAWAIVGCGTNPPIRGTEQNAAADRLNHLLSEAKRAPVAEKNQLLAQAATLLVADKRFDKAQEILAHIELSYLNKTAQNQFQLDYARALLGLNKAQPALGRLQQVKAIKEETLEWQLSYQQTLSDTYFANANYFEAAKIRIELSELLPDQQSLATNNEAIWTALNQMQPSFLEQMKSGFNDPMVNGWLEIVSINKRFANDPEQLMRAMETWKARYPLHPAHVALPKVLQRLADAPVFRPKKIAVLLPLSGKLAGLGQMVSDGIMAAHYQNNNAENAPQLKIYDSAKHLSILTTYQQVVADGAEFVIGPLTKTALKELLAQEGLPLPMLALNQVEEDGKIHPTVYQFGLPVEDEAVQIAHRAWELGQRKAIAFVRNNQFGQRAVDAFKAYFEQLGGEVISIEKYDDGKKLKTEVQHLLGVDKSLARKRQLSNLLGRNLEFEVRRRQDADFIFLQANSSMGRRIKPFINYYYAHDLPVMATSEIFSGEINPKTDIDLNGIEFPDIPLLISKDKRFENTRSELKEVLPEALTAKGRFFSLGYDAYKMLSQLARLQAFPDYRWYGMTGELGVDEKGNIHRYLTWARFNRGKPGVTKERLPQSISNKESLNKLSINKESTNKVSSVGQFSPLNNLSNQ